MLVHDASSCCLGILFSEFCYVEIYLVRKKFKCHHCFSGFPLLNSHEPPQHIIECWYAWTQMLHTVSTRLTILVGDITLFTMSSMPLDSVEENTIWFGCIFTLDRVVIYY